MALSQIRKRGGKIVLFNKEKITNAIFKAAVSVGGKDKELAKKLSNEIIEIIESKYDDNNIPIVEHVQDIVEKVLIERGHALTAKAYILYREKRRQTREAKLTLLDIEQTMDEYLQRSDWRVNENANVDFSLGGLVLYISGKITANYWLNNVYTKAIRDAHYNADFHLHDLSMFTGYCSGWSLKQLITEGFGGVPNRLETVPAKHFDTIIGQMVNFLGTLQNEWAGAQAFSFAPETPIIIKRNGKIETLTLEKLYEEYSHHEKKFNKFSSIFTQNIYRKYSIDDSKQHKYMDNRILTEPILFQYDNIEILSKKGFVSLEAITKHKSKGKNDELLQIETEDGRILSVSSSHPMILKNKTKNVRADKLKIGDELILGDMKNLFDYNTEKIKLNKDFSWLIGVLIAEGCWGHQKKEYTIVSQKKNKPLRNKIEKVLKKLKIPYKENGEFNIVFGTTSMGRFIRNHLKLQNKCFRKNFPEFIYQMDYESLGAILSGYIDGDGENERNKQVRIHTTSLTLVTQLKNILDCLNINSTIRLSKPAKNSKHDCYCMRFKIEEDKLFLFKESLKLSKIRTKKKISPKFSTKVIKIRGSIYQPEYLYDITTETNEFLICNILVHNSSFDTYLAPFVRHDKMNYKQVKQQMQRFMFNLATPSRWGCQCVPIDTEALTDKGWKKYDKISKKDKIATFNIKTKKIEYLTPLHIKSYDFDGYLINLKNRTQDQLVTPDHKVVIKDLKSKKYQLVEAEKLLNAKNIKIPTVDKNSNKLLSKHINITRISRKKFKGKVWCPTTKNGTFVARRDNKVFITGNTPFTNTTHDWIIPDDMKNLPAIIGGKEQNYTYGDCQEEADMVNKAFIECMTEGDASKRIFTFPIPTYNVTKDFDWDSENADLLFEMTAKYGIPYFQNFINSDLNPNDVRSMCCRLRLDLRELRNKTGGLFGSGENTGSIGVVTMNMPRIGYLANTEDEFIDRLGYLMVLAKESLEIKRKIVSKKMEQGLIPYTKRYLGTLDNHFSTIGLNGMNEACLNLFGENIATQRGRKFSIKTLEFMRDKLADFQEETKNIYNLEATPGEGTSYRLAKIDKKKFPDIITAGQNDPYYTSSSLLPVGYTDDFFEALELQDDLQTKYTGGTVMHGFMGERLNDAESTKKLVKRIAYNFRLPYYTITPTFSVCQQHGYLRGEQHKCPNCDANTEVYSRVVGFLRPVHSWNDGKKEEFRERKMYHYDKSMNHEVSEEMLKKLKPQATLS